jgi:hypothetical protein
MEKQQMMELLLARMNVSVKEHMQEISKNGRQPGQNDGQ